MVFQHTGHSKAARGKIGFDVAILLEPDWQTSEVKRLDQNSEDSQNGMISGFSGWNGWKQLFPMGR